VHRPRAHGGLRRRGAAARRRRDGRRPARPRDGELPDRGARARRPLVQLPEARRHRDDRRPGVEDRERARLDPELRQEVDRGGQGDARPARPAAPRRQRWRLRDLMRHQRSGKKLGRDSSHRRALYANLASQLIEHERIQTTLAKAKAVKPIAEQMITLGRRGDIHARRQAVAFLGSKDIVHKLFDELGPRYAERPGGYSRIVPLGPRPGDAAEMGYLELVDTPLVFRTRLADLPEGEADEDISAAEEAAEPEAEVEDVEPEAAAEPDEAEEEALETEEAEEEPEPAAEAETAVEDEAEPAP